jgi:hypothetical protein
MTETKNPPDLTMASAKRTRDNLVVEINEGTPNPKGKKAPRSILEGKKHGANDNDLTSNEENEDMDDPIGPPQLNRALGQATDTIRSNLHNKFDQVKPDDGDNDDHLDTTKKTYDKSEQNNNKNTEYDNNNNNNNDTEATQIATNKGGPDAQSNENDNQMEADTYCLEINHGGFKKHISDWKAITEGVMNNSQILSTSDAAYITDLLENIAEEMKVTVATMDKDAWIKVFIQTKDISGARNKKRFVQIFGVSLAQSDPTTLFSHDIFDGNKLLATTLGMVWAAAYTLYGAGWLKDTIDIGLTIAPTTLFKSCVKTEILKAKPFLAAKVYTMRPPICSTT